MKSVSIASALVAACLVLAGCSAGTGTAPATPAAPADSAAPAATAAPAPATSEAPATTDSDFAVTIDGSSAAKDYEGKPAIVVDYTFTNNSDKATSFMVAVTAKAFQQGVELEMAVSTDVDNASGMKEIKPGATIKVQEAYVLADESEVTVEVKELFSLSDDLIATQTFPAK